MFRRIISIVVFGVLTGVVASLASILFVELVEFCNELLWVTTASRQKLTAQTWFVPVAILVPTLGGLVVGLLCMTNAEKRPLTIADTIQSAHALQSVAPLKSGLTTALASMVAIGCGASVGQYGPLAHLGATLGAWISRLARSTGYTATMGIGCGVAAAIATAFNAPIAGLLFAHEVILRHYSLRAFAPITVSATTGYVFANYIFDRPPLLSIDVSEPVYTAEFLAFMIIGVAGAYLATIFMRTLIITKSLADQIDIAPYFKPSLAGAVLGMVAIWLPEVLGIGESVLHNAVSGSVYSNTEMVMILIAKLLLTALCLGFGFAGGIFSPALMIGILFGALVGNVAPYFLGDNHSVVAVYAICGMVAVTSPVIGAPLTAILIVFELTRNYDLTIAAMVSVVFANLVGYQLMGRSIFDIQLKALGFDLSMGRDKVVMDSHKISAYLSQDYVSTRAQTSLATLRNQLIDGGQSEGYILAEAGVHQGQYLGRISLLQIVELERSGVSADETCGDYLVREPLYQESLVREQGVLTSDTTIGSAIQQMQYFSGKSIPVVADSDNNIFLGVVAGESIIKAYMDALHKVRREEHGAD